MHQSKALLINLLKSWPYVLFTSPHVIALIGFIEAKARQCIPPSRSEILCCFELFACTSSSATPLPLISSRLIEPLFDILPVAWEFFLEAPEALFRQNALLSNLSVSP